MKNLLIICFLIFALKTNAQLHPYHPFPSDSAQWSVRFENYSNGISFWSRQYKMKNGDTLINNKTYHKVYTSTTLAYDYPFDTLHCFVREDSSKKVWIKYPLTVTSDTNEFVLYDFALIAGDTFHYHLIFDTTHLGVDILIIDTVWDGQFSIITYGWQLINPPYFYAICDQGGWYQGRGDSWSPFYCEFPFGFCQENHSGVQCFWQNGSYVYGGSFCDVSGIESFNGTNFSNQVFPNPVVDESILKIDKLSNLIITNEIGKVVKRYFNTQELILNSEEYSSGIYLYDIISKDKKIIHGKFIVQ